MSSRILEITHALYPQALGGVELYALECARALGCAVFSFEPLRGAAPKEWSGLEVLTPHARESASAAWRRALATVRPGAVLVQHLGAASPALLRTLVELRIPYAVFVHDFTQLCPTHKLWHRRNEACAGPGLTGFKCAWCVSGTLRRAIELPARTWRYQHRPEQWFQGLARAAVLVVETRYLRDFWIEQGAPPERILVLPVRLPAAAAFEPARLDAAERSLFYGGGWGVAKGAGLLAEALDHVHDGVKLVVAGHWDPPAQTALRRVVAPRHAIRFAGLLEPEALQRVLAGCRAAVVPSRWQEAYGRIAAEAQQLGLPVVATAVGGLPERIIHGVNGFLAAPDDAAGLALAIEEALAADASTGWDAALVRRNAALEAEDALRKLRALADRLPDAPEPALEIEYGGLRSGTALDADLIRALRAVGDGESGTAPPALLRAAWTATRLRRVHLNHAIAFFHAAGCRRIAEIDPGFGDAPAWFQAWGLEPNAGIAADGILISSDPPPPDWAALRLQFPGARAAAWVEGEALRVRILP